MKISVEAKLAELGENIESISGAMREQFKHAIAGIARGAQAEWIRLAQERLKSSRADYIDGLSKAQSFKAYSVGTKQVYEVQLVGRMPNNFEFGMAGFDMKSVRPGWLGGSKAKTNKEGKKYISIPFRHSMSSSARVAYSGRAAKMGLQSKLKSTAKRYGLDKMIRSTSGRVIPGPVARVPNVSSVHPFLRGLTRIQKPTSSGKGSSTMMTFRTMSENSSPSSWVHPGIVGAKILPIVERWVDTELGRVIKTILESSR